MGQVLLQGRESVGVETRVDSELAKVRGFRKVTDGKKVLG